MPCYSSLSGLFGGEYVVRLALTRPVLANPRWTLLDLVSLLLQVLWSLRLLRLITVVHRLDERATVSPLACAGLRLPDNGCRPATS
ncbi:MAG: hypothetical protein ABI232_00845, partial [Jatrophihabitantaceae bacterium]